MSDARACACRWSASAATISAAASTSRRRGASCTARSTSGITLFDTADTYGNRGGSETHAGRGARRAAQGHRARDQIRHADGRRRKALKGASRRYIMAAVEASLAPPEDRLDRPLPASPARPADADRGDAARARRSRAPGQGALHRMLQSRRLAGRRRRSGLRAHHTSPDSCRRRTSTACSYATSNASSSPRSTRTASVSCRTSRSAAACSPASTSTRRRCRRIRASPTPSVPPIASSPSGTGASSKHCERSARARTKPARARVLVARVARRRVERHRRRDQPRSDRRQHRGGRMAVDRR